MNILAIFVAALAGVTTSLQTLVLSRAEVKVGVFGNIFLVYASGFFACLIYYFAVARFPLSRYTQITWTEATGGVLGCVVVGCLGFAALRIGVLPTLVLVFLVQLLSGSVIDHFGIMGTEVRTFDLNKIIAVCFLSVGAFFLLRS